MVTGTPMRSARRTSSSAVVAGFGDGVSTRSSMPRFRITTKKMRAPTASAKS